ncbi:MAG: oligosaccharide flippase family protein [Bacteroidetes bacterium]|nr:oligosaccharide flippase family protein [Bacteroidota bacterium]MDA0879007.1 oligosaccharide flippase family protein [Bacteroidota bacterium]MDA1115914.1 oligosaccharide flippase family protein [Bacteroidota bacterium]
MKLYSKLFQQTTIYGLATVIPRMLSFILVPLYTTKGVLSSVADYGTVSLIFSWFVLFNVLLSYGMETAFFRFFYKEKDPKKVEGTTTIALLISSAAFLILSYLGKGTLSAWLDMNESHFSLVAKILVLDAAVVIPFAYLRAKGQAKKYALIKITNVAVGLLLNVFFLLELKHWKRTGSWFDFAIQEQFEINYIFIANLIASALTLVLLLPYYRRCSYQFDLKLLRSMLVYAWPILVAGLAFAVNETFDRVLLDRLLPSEESDVQIGMYSACYKIAIFMTLFSTAFRLGIEPFYFQQANQQNPQRQYARILELFVLIGSLLFLTVVVFADFIKVVIVRSEAYWEAMWVVPIVLLANFFLGIYHNLSVWYKVTDRTNYGLVFSLIGAGVTLGINFWLIPSIGFKGSALATLSAYGIMALLSAYVGHSRYPIPYNWFKIGFYLSMSTIAAFVSFYYFRGNIYVGMLFLLMFISTVLWMERRQVKQFKSLIFGNASNKNQATK